MRHHLLFTQVLLLIINVLSCHWLYTAYVASIIPQYICALITVCATIAAMLCILLISDRKKELSRIRTVLYAGAVTAAYLLADLIAIPFVINNLLNDGRAAKLAMTTALGVSYAFVTVVSVLIIKNLKKVSSRHTVHLACLATVFAVVSACLLHLDSYVGINYRSMISTDDITFDTMSVQQAQLTDSEKQQCISWYEDNILYAGSNGTAPAYDFTVNGIRLSDTFDSWVFEVGETGKTGRTYRNGKTTVITATNARLSLKAEIEATVYEDNAVCEWVVNIKNTGSSDSGLISGFYALNAALPVSDEAELYYSKGSNGSAEDFKLYKTSSIGTNLSFSATNGRSSDAYMPYFNISSPGKGYTVGVGWTGQWQTSFRSVRNGLNVSVKQQQFAARLLAGEQIRSPLVALSFYSGGNALKGFNSFRSWISGCVSPKNADICTLLEISKSESAPASTEIAAAIDSVSSDVLEATDYFRADADADGELSGTVKRLGIGLALRYEPEHVYKDTELWQAGRENAGWIIERRDSSDILWNLADNEAAVYLASFVNESLRQNGVSVYCQDFSMEPLRYWHSADRTLYSGRTGICENHYVTNYYRYLDSLLEANPGLLIDNSSNGGRRLDLEMVRRSIPLWRSDYNSCDSDDIPEATQAQTYGLSFWLPVSGTASRTDSDYAAKSFIVPCVTNTLDGVKSEHYRDYSVVRRLMGDNYYPMSSSDSILGMQFDNGGLEGTALIYKRADCEQSEYALRFSGLYPDTSYRVYVYERPETAVTMTGDELMNSKYSLPLPDAPEAEIVIYKAAA